jgi:tripartite-type tricarboxylate transporter receptor subunit TctC
LSIVTPLPNKPTSRKETDMKSRRHPHLVTAFISISIAVLLCGMQTVRGEDFPKRPIRIVIPFNPGGGVDTTARGIVGEMEKYLKGSVVCENKPGGGGAVGLEWVSRQKPDGYTLGMLPSSAVVLQYTGVLGLDINKNFDLISLLTTSDNAISVPAGSSFRNIKDLLDHARKNPNKVKISNNGTGSMWHLCAVGLEQAGGAKFIHVPFDGGKPAVVAMIGGHVDVSSSAIGEVAEFVKAGKARILGIPSPERFSMFPDVPTFKEQGFDLTMGGFVGVLAPKGVPKEIIKLLEDASSKGAQSEEFKTNQEKFGNRVYYLGSEKFTRFVEVQGAAFNKAIKEIGLDKVK